MGKSYVTSPAVRAMMRNLAVNVRALRQAQGWSLRELGERSGIPWRTLENIEAEANTTNFVAVAWLAETFDITINRLIYYPREALDGRVRDRTNGRFVVPEKRDDQR
jgi:transcriptional regulator with XRE-family HTH domain